MNNDQSSKMDLRLTIQQMLDGEYGKGVFTAETPPPEEARLVKIKFAFPAAAFVLPKVCTIEHVHDEVERAAEALIDRALGLPDEGTQNEG